MGWAPPELDQAADASAAPVAWAPPEAAAPALAANSWAPGEYKEAQMAVPSNGSAPLVAVTPSTIFTDGNSVAAPLDGSSAGMASALTDPAGTDDLENVKQATAMTGGLMKIMGGKALDFVGQGLHSLGKLAQNLPDPNGMSWAQQPGDAPVTELGADIHKAASSLVNQDPVLRDSWIGQAAGASGTVAGMAASSLINPTAAGALFAGGAGEELANAAEKDGQPQSVIDQARGVGTLLGAGAAAIPLGQLSRVFARYNINPYVRNLADGLMEVLPQASIQKRLLYTGIEAAKSGTLGATVGAGYQLGMNAANNAFTGPGGQVPWNQNVGQTAAMFGIPTAIAGGVAPWQRAGTVYDREPFYDQPVQVRTSQAPIADLPAPGSAPTETTETTQAPGPTEESAPAPTTDTWAPPEVVSQDNDPRWQNPPVATDFPIPAPTELQDGGHPLDPAPENLPPYDPTAGWSGHALPLDPAPLNLDDPGTVSTLRPDYPVVETPLDQIMLSADVPNFKSNADPDSGVVAGDQLQGSYNRLGTGNIVLWKRLNGDLEVISGRHRFDLAQRTGETTIPSQIVHESQGFTAQDAAALDAELNIRDGQGTVGDYARYFRNTPQVDQSAAEQGGLLSRVKGRSGFALGRSASDDLYALYQAGRIPEAKAVAIATAAPGNTGLQQAGMKRADSLSAAELPGYMAILARQTPPEAQQVGLFGESDDAINQAESLAKAANAQVREISDQISAVQGAQKRPEAAAKLGVDVKDPIALAAKLAELKDLRQRYSQFWLHNDLLTSLGAKPIEAPVISTVPTIATHGEGNLFQESEMPFNLTGQVDSSKTPAEQAEEKRIADAKADLNQNQGALLSGGGRIKPAKPLPLLPDTPEEIQAHIYGPPVAVIHSGIIQARPGEKASDAVFRWLKENPQNDLYRPGLGKIIFNDGSVKSSLGHKFSGPKLNSFAAVPAVIQRGVLLDSSMDFTGKDLIHTLLASPITLDGKPMVLFVRLRQDSRVSGNPHFYVHEVALLDGISAPDSFKTGASTSEGSQPSGGIGRMVNVLRKALSVNPQPESFQSGGSPSFKEASNQAAAVKSSQETQTAPGPVPAPVVANQSAVQQKLGWTASIRAGWRAHVSLPLARTFFPASLDESASRIALITRHLNGERSIALQRADHALESWRNQFDRTPVPRSWRYDPLQPLPPNYAFINAIETSRGRGLPKELQDLADAMRSQLDERIAQVQELFPNALQNLLPNYFAHVWQNPNAAEVMNRVVMNNKSLEGSKGFMKQRTLTYFTDGLKAGLTPISDNPVDIHLFKLAEMDRFVMAHTILKSAEASGLRKFVGIFQRPPDGWSLVEDKTSAVHAPPWVTVTEAFNQQLYDGAMKLIRQMGWNYERTLSDLKAKGFEKNTWGFWQPSTESLKQREFTGDMVLFHEIGHGLDQRYHLLSWLEQRIPKDVLQGELTALSNARKANAGGGKFGDAYIHSRVEQMAEITKAYVLSPDVLRSLAPRTAAAYVALLDAHPELHEFRDLRPGLELGLRQVQVPVHGMVTLGNYYMPDGAAQVLNNFLSPGLGNAAWYRGLKSISNLMNAAELGLSAFHLGFTSVDAAVSQVSVGLWQALHGHPIKAAGEILTSPAAPVTNFIRGWQLQKAMLQPGGSSSQLQRLADLAVQGGLRATMDPFWKTEFTRSLRKSLAGVRMNLMQGQLAAAGGDSVRAALKVLPTVIEQIMRPIAEGIVPRQKLGVFAKLMQLEIQRLGPKASAADLRAAAARCADTTEDRMGQLTYDNLFHNKVAKDLMLLVFRAYGWQLGKYRAMAKAAGEAGGAVKSIATGKAPDISTNLTYPVALVMVAALLGGITMKLMTGRNPESLMDYFFPQSGNLDPSGRPQRLALPTYLKDLMSDWHDFPDAKKMGVSIWHKMNPMFSTLADMFNNKDFYGVEIRHEDDPAWKQAMQLCSYMGKAFVPFSITGMQKLSESGGGPAQYVLPFIGVVPAKASLSMTPAEARAMDLYSGTLPQGSRTQDQADHSRLVGKIRNAMTQNPAQGSQLLSQNIQQLHGSDLAAVMKDRGVPVITAQTMKLTLDQGMSVFDLGNALERQQLAPMLMRKLGAAVNNRAITPEVATNYAKVLSPAMAGAR